jgi:recombinational DNA repair protein (RecF pathway)
MRDPRYCCALCDRLTQDDRCSKQFGKMICPQCSSDHIELVELYNEIIRARPQYKNYTAPQLFRIMWERLKGPNVATRSESNSQSRPSQR